MFSAEASGLKCGTMSSVIFAVLSSEYLRVAISERGKCGGSRSSHSSLNIRSLLNDAPLRRRIFQSISEGYHSRSRPSEAAL